jgi:AraC family transcriptional regulator
MDRPETALFRALSFIETHLDEDLSVERVAREASYSPFHFHRLFAQLTGETFAAYVRRLRLESSSVLLRSGRPVTDAALSSGYWTHEAFTRAFRRSFGRAPREFATAPLPEGADDRWLDRPRRMATESIDGWRRRVVGPYDQVVPPGSAGSPWPADAERRLGLSWDDPSVTRADQIRYDVLWTVRVGGDPGASDGVVPGRIEGGPVLAALHRGPFSELTASYHYLLFMAPRQWDLRLHPTHPPYEEFVADGILIRVPLE